MSKRGCIEQPTANDSQLFVAMSAIIPFPPSSGVITNVNRSFYGGNAIIFYQPSGIASSLESAGIRYNGVFKKVNFIVSEFSPIEMKSGFSNVKLKTNSVLSMNDTVQLNSFIFMSVAEGISSAFRLFVIFRRLQISSFSTISADLSIVSSS